MTKIYLPEPECNRTGTGNIFNLILRMPVPADLVSSVVADAVFDGGQHVDVFYYDLKHLKLGVLGLDNHPLVTLYVYDAVHWVLDLRGQKQ